MVRLSVRCVSILWHIKASTAALCYILTAAGNKAISIL